MKERIVTVLLSVLTTWGIMTLGQRGTDGKEETEKVLEVDRLIVRKELIVSDTGFLVPTKVVQEGKSEAAPFAYPTDGIEFRVAEEVARNRLADMEFGGRRKNHSTWKAASEEFRPIQLNDHVGPHSMRDNPFGGSRESRRSGKRPR